MSDDCCAGTGCSADAGIDSGTCTETITSADTTTSVNTVNSGQEIDSAINDVIDNQQSISFHSPIPTEDAGTQTMTDGNTSQTKNSKCTKISSFLPCIRIVVFILVVIVLLLICKLKIAFACFYPEASKMFLIFIFFFRFCFYFQGLNRRIIKCAF